VGTHVRRSATGGGTGPAANVPEAAILALQLQIPNPGAEGRVSALQFGPDGRLLAAVWRAEGNLVCVAWWDLRRGEQTETLPGAQLGEDDATPPDPAISPDHRLLARMQNERGGVQLLVLVDRSTPKHRTHKLTAWPYERPDDYPGDYNYQAFAALAFVPDGSHLYALVQGGEWDVDG
jgi:hypothetical protein